MKKFISMLLVLALSLSLLSTAAFATDFDSGLGDWDSTNPCGANLVWSLVDGVLTISGTGAMTDWTTAAQSIPWAGSADEITKVVVCDGVTTIGGRAFQDMTALTCVILPETLTSVGAYAFDGCTELDAVCFAGTEAQWEAVSVPGTADLDEKTVYFVTQVGDHWIAHIAEKAAACEIEGNLEHWYCPECGGYFADAEATEQTTVDAVTVAALEHNYENGICTICYESDPNADVTVISFGADLGAVSTLCAAYKDGQMIGMFDALSLESNFYAAVPNDLYNKMDTAKLFQLDANYAPITNAATFEK